MSQMRSRHQPRKRFGQNFLHDPGVIARIAAAIHPQPEDALVEIGPGQGALTELLLESNPALQVLELDRDLIPLLRSRFARHTQLRIHEGDALRFDFSQLYQGTPLRVVGNLPYNISTPLIFHLLGQADIIADMHFLLQKEVVDRLAAGPGSGAYGRLGIMAQYWCRVQPLFEVGPGAFHPAPKVTSALVRLVPHRTLPYPARDRRLLEQVVRTAFNARRKTLRRALASLISAERLGALGIDAGLRPENLALADYVVIAEALAQEQSHD